MLSEEQRVAFASLRAIWPEQRIVLIGAGALRAHGKLVRFTADLDVAIAVDESEYPGELAALRTWKRDPKQDQRWAHQNGVEVDIIAAGAALCARGYVTLLGGRRLSLDGLPGRDSRFRLRAHPDRNSARVRRAVHCAGFPAGSGCREPRGWCTHRAKIHQGPVDDPSLDAHRHANERPGGDQP
jgi:hypothetical protein